MSGKIDHSIRAHALLSASGASRWLNCSPSARLEEKFPNKSSVFSEEGTLAHEISEVKIRQFIGEISDNVAAKELKKLRKDKLYYDGMDNDVDIYVDYVKETYLAIKSQYPEAILLVERRLDFSHLVEKGFGTGDILIVTSETIHVIDLKFGKGVEVKAENNSQLMIYGSGALYEFELMYDIQDITLVIVQPRKENISEWTISADKLREWGETVVKPKAEIAYLGDGEQVTGSWCRFCKAKPICRAHANMNLELAKMDFKDPQLLSDKEVLQVKAQAEVFIEWISSVTDYMKETALQGRKWEGYKLVEGRADRRWVDESLAIKVLKTAGFKPAEYVNTKIKGIGAIETLVGKEKFPELLGECYVKPTGAPTLVDESDKKPALGLEQAKVDFAEDLTI